MEERRQYIRISNPLSVKYRVLKEVFVSSSNSRNVSESGICLPVTHSFAPGVVLALKIYITELDISIQAVGEVVWIKEQNDSVHPFLIGIKFIDISGCEHNKLINYLNKFEITPKTKQP